MSHDELHYTFFENLNDDAVLLTPNRRLSAVLHKKYQQFQLQKNQQAWLTPSILPAATWLSLLWKEYTSLPICRSPALLLNSAQEQCLWETILLDSEENEHLLQISETADLLKSAWGLLKQWQVDLN